MAGEYDLMLPEDRDRKLQDFEGNAGNGLKLSVEGKPDLSYFMGCCDSRYSSLLGMYFYVIYSHVHVALAVRVTVLTLLCNPVFNLLEWHWKDRRYGRKSHRA